MGKKAVNMNNSIFGYFVFTLLSFMLFCEPASGEIISGCANLSIPNTVYLLNLPPHDPLFPLNDSVNSSSSCFTITATNITLDCQGHRIDYNLESNQGYGIYSNASFTTIRNCSIYEQNSADSRSYGVYLEGASDSQLYLSSVATVRSPALFLNNSHRVNITQVQVFVWSSGVGSHGAVVQNSNNVTFNLAWETEYGALKNTQLNVLGGSNSYALLINKSSGTKVIGGIYTIYSGTDSPAIYLAEGSTNTLLKNINKIYTTYPDSGIYVENNTSFILEDCVECFNLNCTTWKWYELSLFIAPGVSKGNWTIINTWVNKTWSAGSTGLLSVYWGFWAWVENRISGSGGVNVTVRNSSGAIISSALTATDRSIPRQNLLEYVQTSATNIDYTPIYNITATKSGSVPKSEIINITAKWYSGLIINWRLADAETLRFIRGDTNNDGLVDISDAINSLGNLFTGSGIVNCIDAADANDDGIFDISDPIFVLGFLFGGGTPIKPPYPALGFDNTLDGLDCQLYTFSG